MSTARERCVSLANQTVAVSGFMATGVVSLDVYPKYILGDRRVGTVLGLIEV